MKYKWTDMFTVVKTVMKAMPMLMLALILNKVASMTCINITNKIYMLLITIAIFTYWTFHYYEVKE